MVVIIHIGKKMKDFIKATDIDMWDNVKSRYEFPKIMIDEVFK